MLYILGDTHGSWKRLNTWISNTYQEVITESDMRCLPNTYIDVVISHTCPEFLLPMLGIQNSTDCSPKYLSEIYNLYNPHYWYFGHFHKYLHTSIDKSNFFCLNCIGEKGCFSYF